MLSGPLVKPPLGDQDVTRYPHGRTWYITSVVLLLYMVAPPQGSIRRRMGIGVEESAEGLGCAPLGELVGSPSEREASLVIGYRSRGVS